MRQFIRRVSACATLAVVSAISPIASAQTLSPLARLNEPYERLPESARSDLVILPLMIDMQRAPEWLRYDVEGDIYPICMLLPAGGPGWDEAADWAAASAQQKLLTAIHDVTQEEDWKKAMVFGQPYGIGGVAGRIDLIQAGLYTELGEPPLLAAADIGYYQPLTDLFVLSHIEATRRADQGDFEGALLLLRDWIYFSRQIADRPTVLEKRFAMYSMLRTLERVRDIAYLDFISDRPSLTWEFLVEYLDEFDAEVDDYLGFGRIDLPYLNFYAAKQALEFVIERNGEVIREAFPEIMARVTTGNHPLRMFSEAAYWRSVMNSHAGWYKAHDMADGVLREYQKRWFLPITDPIRKHGSDLERRVRGNQRFAVIDRIIPPGVEEMIGLKDRLHLEAGGVRMGLGVYAYHLRYGKFPNVLTSIRPAIVDTIETDPFSEQHPPAKLNYFVPVRDNIPPQHARQSKRLFQMTVYPPNPYPSFELSFDEANCIIYSIYEDTVDQVAQEIVNFAPDARIGDYLLWPPQISLVRKNFQDTGDF